MTALVWAFLMIWSLCIFADERVDYTSEYLYQEMGSAAYPIHEPVYPDDFPQRRLRGSDDEEDDLPLPDFLAKSKGNRVVEFYVPWCQHCHFFKTKYVEFAKTFHQTAGSEYGLEDGTDTMVSFHAVSCVPLRSICVEYGVKRYPKLMIIPDGKTAADDDIKIINSFQLHPNSILYGLGLLEDFVEEEADLPEMEVQTMGVEEDDVDRTVSMFDKYPRTKTMLFRDASLAFDFAMRNGIYARKGALPEDTSTLLEDWLELLNIYLPIQYGLQGTVNELAQPKTFEKITSSEKKLLKSLDKFTDNNSNEVKWSTSCTKGNPFAGYSCGLWQLFHLITVGTVEWNTKTADATMRWSMKEVSDTIRNYIENFFGCDICRIHFLEQYDVCFMYRRCDRLTDSSKDGQDWKQLPLWLWEVHNGVNVRLMHERATGEGRTVSLEEERAAQWPSRKACPICWNDDDSEEDAILSSPFGKTTTPAWNEDIVWRYLKMEYSPEDMETKQFRAELATFIKSEEDSWEEL